MSIKSVFWTNFNGNMELS